MQKEHYGVPVEEEVVSVNVIPENSPEGEKIRTNYCTANTNKHKETVVYEEILDQEFKIITPNEFQEDPTYRSIELTYYADGHLVDAQGNDLSIEDTIGADALNHIGDYEPDSVHVRDVFGKVEYEVLSDPRYYEDLYD